MLEVLGGAGLHYTACVVTRYFGGTLLGTGGLVRAYTAAVKAALENAEIIEVIRGSELVLRVTYPQAGRLQYVFAREELPQCEIEYGQDVVMHQFVPRQDVQRVKKLVIESTDGKAEFLEENESEYTRSCHK
jgi:putative IMPACT (imprinted ancient) family translation regulator